MIRFPVFICYKQYTHIYYTEIEVIPANLYLFSVLDFVGGVFLNNACF
jgi:hypothetical protein